LWYWYDEKEEEEDEAGRATLLAKDVTEYTT
jgi:hypothetical protein